MPPAPVPGVMWRQALPRVPVPRLVWAASGPERVWESRQPPEPAGPMARVSELEPVVPRELPAERELAG